MLKSYEAIYEHGHLKWVDEQPPVDNARVIVGPIVDESDWECLR